MQETSFATRIVAMAVQEARQKTLKQVWTAHVRLGAFLGVEPGAIRLQLEGHREASRMEVP